MASAPPTALSSASTSTLAVDSVELSAPDPEAPLSSLDNEPSTPISAKIEEAEEDMKDISEDLEKGGSTSKQGPMRKRDFGFLPIPRRLQWDEDNLPPFGYLMMVIFAFAGAFSVANIYYAQPILIVIARDFNVTYDKTTSIPTLIQASYAVGLVFVCPLGDLLRRRQLLLVVVFMSAILSLILALVNSIIAFQIVSAFQGMFSITGQILIPLAADLAPLKSRGHAIGTVLSGLLFGILLARVLSGLVAEAGRVADVFWMAFGAQVLVLGLLYATVPDYPAKNPELGYFNILKTMCKYAVSEPLLIQSCLVSALVYCVFTCFWVTSTFILGDIYGYNSLQIGLFGLVGMLGVITATLVGKLIDRMVPWFGTLVGLTLLLLSMVLFTAGAAASIAVIVLVIILMDLGIQLQQVSLSTRIFGISMEGRARLSAVFIFTIFLGQLTGTSAGSKLYLQHGYRASGGLCLGWLVLAILTLLARGPHIPNTKWFGWQGGASFRRPLVKVPAEAEKAPDVEEK